MVGACPDAAFRSAQPLHSCARDPDQLVELALFGIPDAAAQKKNGRQIIGSRYAAFSRRGTTRIMRCDHDYGLEWLLLASGQDTLGKTCLSTALGSR